MFSIGLFALLSIITILSMRQITGLWKRTSERDLAMRELLRADRFLTHDLANSAAGDSQWLKQPVQAGTGSVYTGDALAILIPSDDQVQLALTSGGAPVLDRLVTYYPALSSAISFAPLADSQGYEDSCPYKWLVRKETAAPAPPDAYSLPAVPAGWMSSGVIEVPGQLWKEADRKVLCQLHQFRVVQTPPNWTLEITAIAVGEARSKLALGSVLLSPTHYAITHRISVHAQN